MTVSSPLRLPRVDLGGRDIDKAITTKKLMILTGPFAMASIQRYYDAVTAVIKATARRLGWER